MQSTPAFSSTLEHYHSIVSINVFEIGAKFNHFVGLQQAKYLDVPHLAPFPTAPIQCPNFKYPPTP